MCYNLVPVCRSVIWSATLYSNLAKGLRLNLSSSTIVVNRNTTAIIHKTTVSSHKNTAIDHKKTDKPGDDLQAERCLE